MATLAKRSGASMNRFGWTRILTLYLFRHTLIHILLAGLILIFIVNLIDMAELLRRSANKDSISSFTALIMSLLRIPSSVPFILPFAVMFGALVSFYKLSQQNEIIVARSSGLSMLQIIFGPILSVMLISLVMLVVIDPISSATNSRFIIMEEQKFGSTGRNLTVSTEGIWLRDRGTYQNLIISGSRLKRSDLSIADGEVYTFDKDNTWTSHYLPETLIFDDGNWQLEGGRVMRQDGTIANLGVLTLPSVLSRSDLTSSNKKPETIPLYRLWSYITVLDQAGLSSLGHRSYLYYQASTPLVLVGMTLIAGYFGLVYRGRKKRIRLIAFAIFSALGFYFFKDIMYVLGSSGRLPPIIAGIAPGFIVTTIGFATLIRSDQTA